MKYGGLGCGGGAVFWVEEVWLGIGGTGTGSVGFMGVSVWGEGSGFDGVCCGSGLGCGGDWGMSCGWYFAVGWWCHSIGILVYWYYIFLGVLSFPSK